MMKKLILSSILGGLIIPLSGFSQKANFLTDKEKKQGWVLLFDGKSTSGWTTVNGSPVPAGWEVTNGTLSAKKGAKGGDIISAGEYADFELMADFNISVAGNSGIKYFFTKYENGGNLGFEYQILDDKLAADNKKANHLTGSFYDVMPPDESQKKINAPGQWNTMRVVAKDKKVEHWLNGIKVLSYELGSPELKAAIAKSKFKAAPDFGDKIAGHIMLTDHSDEVAYRNLKIHPLN